MKQELMKSRIQFLWFGIAGSTVSAVVSYFKGDVNTSLYFLLLCIISAILLIDAKIDKQSEELENIKNEIGRIEKEYENE